jgi:hypothetical protein
MTFSQWLYQDEGFGERSERLFEDIRICVEQERTDDIIKWLMAAYAMGHEQGYDTGYYDCEESQEV